MPPLAKRPRCWAHMGYPAHYWTCSQPATHAIVITYDEDYEMETCAFHLEEGQMMIRLGDYSANGPDEFPVIALHGTHAEPWPNHNVKEA